MFLRILGRPELPVKQGVGGSGIRLIHANDIAARRNGLCASLWFGLFVCLRLGLLLRFLLGFGWVRRIGHWNRDRDLLLQPGHFHVLPEKNLEKLQLTVEKSIVGG